jgi:predicted SnoaL-like aldol condensation-catalyzing enzyme
VGFVLGGMAGAPSTAAGDGARWRERSAACKRLQAARRRSRARAGGDPQAWCIVGRSGSTTNEQTPGEPVMKLLTGAIAMLAVTTAVNAAEPVVAISPEAQRALLASDDPQLAANKKLVWDMWRNFLQAGRIDEADKYLAPEYHQHNPNAETGLEGVKAYFRAAGVQPTEVKNHIDRLVSIVAERDLVVLALVREGKDKDGNAYTTTWFDMFRVADGKIVEHWDTATKP